MRLLIVLAATAVAASIAIPAAADPRSDGDDAKFVTCLRAEGLQIPADARGAAIKEWLVQHSDAAAVDNAIRTCKPKLAQGPGPEELLACLRAKGLEPPAAIDDLKPWLLRQLESGANQEALRACDVAPKEKASGCAGEPRAAEPALKEQ